MRCPVRSLLRSAERAMSDAEDPLSSLPGPVQENATAADSPPASVINRDPVPRLKEILALLLIVVISDVTLYRGEGFAGLSFLLAAAPLLLFLGTPHRERGGVLWLLWGMLLLLSARLLWCGFYLTAVVGFALLPLPDVGNGALSLKSCGMPEMFGMRRPR